MFRVVIYLVFGSGILLLTSPQYIYNLSKATFGLTLINVSLVISCFIDAFIQCLHKSM